MASLDLLGLERLARAASDAGHYNLAKLLRATSASVVNRRLYAEALPKSDAELLAGLDALEPALAEANLDPDLRAGLQQARRALAERGTILYADAPPVLVCRVCGEAVRGFAPDYCMTCGAGRLTFQPFPPTYYLEPEPVPVALGQLAETPGWLDRILAGLSAQQLAHRLPGLEGEWSLGEAAGHLLGSNGLLAARVQLFEQQEAPELVASPPSDIMAGAAPDELAAQFRVARLALLARLRALPLHVWTRSGRHSEFGPVTLQQQVTYFAKHEGWHMAQMTRLRRALETRG